MTDMEKDTRRFHWSMRLILAGLVVELLSLFGLHHPMGFMAFFIIGGTLVVAGILLYLASHLSRTRPPEYEGPGSP